MPCATPTPMQRFPNALPLLPSLMIHPKLRRYLPFLLCVAALLLSRAVGFAEDEEAGGENKSQSIFQTIWSGNILIKLIWCAIIGTSVTMVTFIIQNIMSLRKNKLAPPPLIVALQQNLGAGNYQEAWETCNANRNYLANVLKATRILLDPHGFALSPRRITISTAGIIPQIEQLGREPVRPKLAVSLNASTEEMRRQLMPITRKYHLKDLIEACQAYPVRPWEKLTFEYVLLGGVNDSDADARRVAGLLGNLDCMVNLIALNPGPGIPFETPKAEQVDSFQKIIRRSMPCFVRKPRGRDIFAACGQLKRNS